MAVGLAAIGKQLGLRIKVVIDDSILPINHFLLKSFGAEFILTSDKDQNGSSLSARLKIVNDYLDSHKNVYWFDQYNNPLVCEAYANTLGKELCDEIEGINTVFVAVSSGGTISGISSILKERNQNIKIIAVDIKGSKIFVPSSKDVKHFIGIGSSMISDNIKRAKYDDYVIVSEEESINALNYLLTEEQIFAGISTGSVMAGFQKYIGCYNLKNTKSIIISHDNGERYFDFFVKTMN